MTYAHPPHAARGHDEILADLGQDGRMRRAVDFWGLLAPWSQARLDV